jgi:hypothetical protein
LDIREFFGLKRIWREEDYKIEIRGLHSGTGLTKDKFYSPREES